jgi:HlyD family secretion protein
MRFNSFAVAVPRSVFAIVLIGGLLLAGAWLWREHGKIEAPRYDTAEVDRGDIKVVVSATGTLVALATVEVGSRISGQLLSVEVDFNDRVKAGQVIARIDPAPLRTRYSQADANLSSARAAVIEAAAGMANAEADYIRKRDLLKSQLVSRSDADLALAARDQTRARHASSLAAVRQAQASLESARLDLEYAVIRSPVDGIVLERAVEAGQTVTASFQTPRLFQIVEDLANMQIELSIDESDIGQIRPTQAVSFVVDSYPDRRFEGKVGQIRLVAKTVQNVVTYSVIVDVDNRNGLLMPGMTASAEIDVGRRTDVVRIPNMSLRFVPPGESMVSSSMDGLRIDIEDGLDALLDRLGLSSEQRVAFESNRKALRNRSGTPVALPPELAGKSTGGRGMVSFSVDASTSPEKVKAMIAERMLQDYEPFRKTLEGDQRARFDREFAELFQVRNGRVWRLVDGKLTSTNLRLGLSDGTYTEVLEGGIDTGTKIVVGMDESTE